MAASESNLFARASKVVYIASLNKYFWTRVEDVGGKWVLSKGLFTRREGYPGMRVTLALTHFLFSLRCVYKAARVTWVGRLPYLRARVTLAGRLTFFLVESPGKSRLPGLTFHLFLDSLSVLVVGLLYLACKPGLLFALQLGLTRLLGYFNPPDLSL